MISQLPPVFRSDVTTIAAHGPTDPWHIADFDLRRHQERVTGKGIVVGICDTGVDVHHTELEGRVIDGRNFTARRPRQETDYTDRNDHGTHVATTIAGKNVGVAPEAMLVIAKVLADNGSGSNEGVAEGIRWLVDYPVNAINLSLGGPYDDTNIKEAIAYGKKQGVLFVAATGNENANFVGYPAKHCVAAGAVGRDLKLAWFSNRGKSVDLVAPGVDIYAGIPGNRYQLMSGTSMATPFLSGVAALRLSGELQHGGIVTKSDSDLLKLETRVIDLGPEGKDTSYGRGLVDLDAAFTYDVVLPTLPYATCICNGKTYAADLQEIHE